ncbi:MAG: ArsC family transcriptional regulator [Oscillospiraceae bacterium]|nr:ArsC family transcriptional regulator [Oscillospiraceae bacterium]
MNIQIFGKSKCFDTKKAERFFRERGIRFQSVDLPRKGLSRRELESVVAGVGDLMQLVDPKHPDAALMQYLLPDAQLEKLLEDPKLLRTPIVRNGRKATVGDQPAVWEAWVKEG